MSELVMQTPTPEVRVLTMARSARRNALSRSLISELCHAIQQAETDGIRALVVAGEGPSFSAGADFSGLEGDGSDQDYDDEMSRLTGALEESPLISVAAVQGACIGAGLDLALACDFRVAASDAVFALPAVKMGILYNPQRLAQILPKFSHAAAMRLLLLADKLDQTEALAAGVATHPAQSGQALTMATDLASRAARLPPLAQRTSKAFVKAFHRPDFAAEDWQARRTELLTSDERRTALRLARKPKT
ncbi:enoyl-CoA hydratase/isomerase family protein [Paracoccus sp. MKU1]|uniref:enoyl-CoA hydratase/isomerase family protein n=1 Tax=Paracoccus sp. MKU1 TaxID=1745182 RepID=UPI0007191C32|nr:enoyl-CoA hydratase/isomerase family protein [Paracoccus sp. MKU1]KRW95172.1 hypothetical protein AQY21_16145 [Paracoccus sp. MKU1]